MHIEHDPNELIAHIYESLLINRGSESILDRVGPAIGATSGAVHIVAENPLRQLACFEYLGDYSRSDANSIAAGHYHYFSADVRFRRIANRRDAGVARDIDFISAQERKTSGLYNDVLIPWRINNQLVSWSGGRQDEFVLVNLNKSDRHGLFSDHELAFFRVLAPHINRAASLHLKFGGMDARLQAAAQGYDRLDFGVVFLTRDCRVVHANRAADRIFEMKDGIGVARSGLTITDRAKTQAFRKMLAQVLAIGFDDGPSGFAATMAVPRPSGRPPFAVHAMPIALKDRVFGCLSPSAMLCIFDPDRTKRNEISRVARAYGLTPAETRLVAALVDGASLTEIADRFEVTKDTARTQLKSIFLKTDVSRQGELIALLLKSA